MLSRAAAHSVDVQEIGVSQLTVLDASDISLAAASQNECSNAQMLKSACSRKPSKCAYTMWPHTMAKTQSAAAAVNTQSQLSSSIR